jgi:hypothetical protein
MLAHLSGLRIAGAVAYQRIGVLSRSEAVRWRVRLAQ